MDRRERKDMTKKRNCYEPEFPSIIQKCIYLNPED
jgi:hypothetical protein